MDKTKAEYVGPAWPGQGENASGSKWEGSKEGGVEVATETRQQMGNDAYQAH